MVKRKTPYGSIGIEQEKLDELKAVKAVWEHRAGRSFTWGDFLSVLLTLHGAGQGHDYSQEAPVAEMHQDEPMTEEELAEAGVDTFPGLPVTLSEEDQERIADLVAERVIKALEKYLHPKAEE